METRTKADARAPTAADEQEKLRLELLRQEVRAGLDDVEHERVVSGAEAFAELDTVICP